MTTKTTTNSLQRWPFLPASTHTSEQRERWWRECFTRTPEVMNFCRAEASAVVIGGPGSGKSTAVAALPYLLPDTILLLPYPPHHWPQGVRPWVPGGNHLSQILAVTATEVTRLLSDNPAAFIAVQAEVHNQQFLFWLIESHLGRRTSARLQHRLRQALGAEIVFPETMHDLYETTTRETDVWNQLDELAYLVETMGYSRIIVTIDLNEAEASAHLHDLRDLFSWLDLFEYPKFAIRAAIPQVADSLLHLTQGGNGHYEIIRLRQNNEMIEEILARYLQVTTQGQCQTLREMMETAIS